MGYQEVEALEPRQVFVDVLAAFLRGGPWCAGVGWGQRGMYRELDGDVIWLLSLV